MGLDATHTATHTPPMSNAAATADLIAARYDLVQWGDTDAPVGSKRWIKAAKALVDLAAFDLAHPETLAAAQAEHAAEMASRYQD